MAKQPAGLSQDVGCLCSVVQSQEKNHSFPPVEMLQMFNKLQGSGWTLHRSLALEWALGAPRCTGVNILDVRSWGSLEVLGDGPGCQRVEGTQGAQMSDFSHRRILIDEKAIKPDEGAPTELSPSRNQHFYERRGCLEHTPGAALKGKRRAAIIERQWYCSHLRKELSFTVKQIQFHTHICHALLQII